VDQILIMSVGEDASTYLMDIDRSARTLHSKIEVLAKTSRGAESDRHLIEDMRRRETSLIARLDEFRARAEKAEKELNAMRCQYSSASERFKAGATAAKEKLESMIRENALSFKEQINKQKEEMEAYQLASTNLTLSYTEQRETIAELEAVIQNQDTWIAHGKEREAELLEELKTLKLEKNDAVVNSRNIGDALDQVLSDMISEPAPDDPSKPFVPYCLR